MNQKTKSTNSNHQKLKIHKIFNTIFHSKRFVILLILFVCFIFACSPKVYIQSFLNALTVWAVNVLPVLFPFFVFTNIIVMLSDFKPNKIDKVFSKIYKTPNGASSIYFLSVLSGYPVGAKLVSGYYFKGSINKQQAENMLSFCSVSGPMFMLGTVGVCIFGSKKFGLIILCSNIIASLINGLFYCKKNSSKDTVPSHEKSDNILSKSVYESMINILLVGAYICLSFLLIDMLQNLGILKFISNTICRVTNNRVTRDIVESLLVGIIEITRGCLNLSLSNLPINLSVVLCSGIIGFGGLSVFMQSAHFFDKMQIKKSLIFRQKISQGFFATLISIILSLVFY